MEIVFAEKLNLYYKKMIKQDDFKKKKTKINLIFFIKKVRQINGDSNLERRVYFVWTQEMVREYLSDITTNGYLAILSSPWYINLISYGYQEW